MKTQLDAALLPANDANWNTGARFWARYLRCDLQPACLVLDPHSPVGRLQSCAMLPVSKWQRLATACV